MNKTLLNLKIQHKIYAITSAGVTFFRVISHYSFPPNLDTPALNAT